MSDRFENNLGYVRDNDPIDTQELRYILSIEPDEEMTSPVETHNGEWRQEEGSNYWYHWTHPECLDE